ncbi:MAG: phosphatase PAP2 family protein [Desulfitobacteriaceae bacterium]
MSLFWGKSGRWVSYPFTILAVLTAFARLYTGLHWPSDILGGILVGIVSARIT